MLNRRGLKECLSCTEPMDAVYCYTIRTMCDVCGGKSLVVTDKKGKKLDRVRTPAQTA